MVRERPPAVGHQKGRGSCEEPRPFRGAASGGNRGFFCVAGVLPLDIGSAFRLHKNHEYHVFQTHILFVVVALLHVWRRNSLLSIGAGTICYMILVQAVFA